MKLAMVIRFLFLLILLCKGVKGQNLMCLSDRFTEVAIYEPEIVTALSDIPYASVQNYFTGQQQTLMLDVYAPDSTVDLMQSRPVVILMHGGSWFSGSRQAMELECREYARRGFVAVSISYRLGWNCDLNNPFAACGCAPQNLRQAVYLAVQDARAAMRFVAQHQDQWNLNPHWMFIGGESAGAITALLAAFWEQSEAETFVSADFVSAVGALDDSGNTIEAGYTVRGCINHCGGIPNLTHLINNPEIPIVSFHDSQDCVVPTSSGSVLSCLCGNSYFTIQGSQSIHNAVVSAGFCSELHLIPQPLLPNHCSYPKLSLVKKAACFMKRRMCNFCMNSQTDNPSAASFCGVSSYSVDIPVTGCTYAFAINYNSSATVDDGSCVFSSTCPADLDTDGIVGVSDLIIFMGEFGHHCNE